MIRIIALSLAVIAWSLASGWPQTADPPRQRVVDLSHGFGPRTLYWPTSPTKSTLEKLTSGQPPGGDFYSANSFCTPEHGGTHLDAPIHFSERGRTVAEIPLEQLVAPAVVIDVASKEDGDRNYRLTPEDVRTYEKQHGAIARGSIVLMRTGWSRYWPDAKAYLGDDTTGDASKLSFPNYGADAEKLLDAESRRVDTGIGH